ncbi:Coenzyme F420 hydrogenase/dehydrogenase, beta subunit C-terminal domain [Bariatricus sp. HCP28S3_E4]|uniref:Coenzyme F420 hydrogenase/dehydrogenase, beta subunit C-terminal domain n=1 Tax=unclassified Bariatricus TaxID=2677046 RepID=UPI003F8C9B02
MRFFVGDYILREACSDCHFKGYSRVSDITLGDFWGIWDVCPEMDDNKGTSLVLLHSQKGKQLFQAVSDRMEVQEVSLMNIPDEFPSAVR